MSTFTINSIEGNSYIGVPVFSRFGQMQNYNYIVLSPQKKMKEKVEDRQEILDEENLKFAIDGIQTDVANKTTGV
jgi:hypothetical protein